MASLQSAAAVAASLATSGSLRPGIAAAPPVLTLDKLSKCYGATRALDDLSLSVPSDLYVSILGASGSGKTVLLRSIAGFEALDAGTVSLGGRPLAGVPAHQRQIGFVFQNFALFPHLTVEQNVGFGLANAATGRLSASAIAARVKDMIGLVGLGGLEGRGVHQISGGQRQRVALARTLVTEPRLVLLDEPLGALDANLRARMCGELRRLRERLGVTFLHVTGSETEALAMGDHVVVLDAGRVAQSGPPATIYTAPATARVARFLNCYNLMGAEPVDGQVPAGDPASSYAIRQDLIGVRPARGPVATQEVRLGATYVTSEYAGAAATYFFRRADGGIVTVEHHFSHHEPQSFEPGEAYDLVWRRADALLVPGASASRASTPGAPA